MTPSQQCIGSSCLPKRDTWISRLQCAGLTLLLLVTMPAGVHAQYVTNTINGQISIARYTGPGGDVVIPDTINGLPVTEIADSAFGANTNLTSVTIPDSVTHIG